MYTGAYQGGVVTHQATHTTFPGDYTNSETRNSYVWWDSALNNVTDYDAQSHTGALYPYHATYSYDSNGRLSSVGIVDGRSRTVSFVTDANGLILQRDENDANTTTGDPRELHFYFNGMAVGDVGNNGTSDIDYAASIAEHTATPGTGPFRNGGSTYIIQADFDQSYDPINGLTYENTASRYTVTDGDTLESIAYQIWGDSSFWYMIADANGLSGSETLVAGQDLIIPNKVHNAHNSADTYRVYDPNEAIGNNSPTAPKPQKHGGGACGGFGQIIVAVISIAVTMLLPVLAPLTFSGFLGGVAAAAIGSAVGQGVGVATGIQSKFDWGAVAMSAISAGVGYGLGVAIPGTNLGAEVARGVLGNAITQGIGVATGLQKRFDWASVAAAGVMAGVSGLVSENMPGAAETHIVDGMVQHIPATFGNQFVSGMAGALAGAGAATLINGRDFGDNLMSLLPSVIGQTIGNAVAEGMSGSSSAGSMGVAELAKDGGKFAYTYEDSANGLSTSEPGWNKIGGNKEGFVQIAGDGAARLPKTWVFGPQPADRDGIVQYLNDLQQEDRESDLALTGGRGSDSLESAALDTLRAAWNGAVDAAQLMQMASGTALVGPSFDDLKATYDTPAFGNVMEVLLGFGAPKLVGLGEKLVLKFANVLNSSSKVWDFIKATDVVYDGSVIPRSFELSTPNGAVWVNPNATKHLNEFINSSVQGEMENWSLAPALRDLKGQIVLGDLRSAVSDAIANGIPSNTVVSRGWQLSFDTRQLTGPLPVLKHARWVGP